MPALLRITSQLTPARQKPNPITSWHLLSLDAPTVAALWTWFLADANHIHLPLISVLSMATAVWMLYAADRLLDARHLLTNPLHSGGLEDRHRFHHQHRSGFLAGIVIASGVLAMLIPRLDPQALHLYLILGAFLTGYFILVHATGSAHRLPKEIAVGLFFSAAVFIPTIARAPELRLTLLPAAALFALLCSLNCLFIYRWEHPTHSGTASTPHPATRVAVRHLTATTVICLAANLLLAVVGRSLSHPTSRAVPGSCAACCALLLLLHWGNRGLSPLELRTAADITLLTPLLLLPLRHLYRA